MNFPGQNNISFALIGKSVAAVTDATLIQSIDDLLDGQIALVDQNNKAMNGQTITLGMKLRFVQRSGTQLKYTPHFTANNATVKLTGYTAPANQVSFIGYNGSAGSLDVIDNNYYSVWLTLLQSYNGIPYMKDFSFKSAKTSSTQVQLATGLYDGALKSFGREPYKYIKFERVASGTVAAFGTATIVKYTKGSKTVSVYTKSAAGDATVTASTTSVTANALINVPTTNGRSFSFTADALGSGAGHTVIYIGTTSYVVADAGSNAQNAIAIATAINAGTQATAAVTSSTTVTITYLPWVENLLPPLVTISSDDSTFTFPTVTIVTGDAVPVQYIVPTATTSAATFTLDYEWAGETGYVYTNTTAATNTGITTPTNYGLKLTGLSTTFLIDKLDYAKQAFSLILKGFTATTATGNGVNSIGIASSNGVGTYEQVAQTETFSDYNYGKILRGIYLTSDALPVDAVINTKYEIVTISAKKYVDSLNGSIPSPFVVYLCYVKDSSQGDQLATDLNTYYSSGAFPA